MSLLRNFRFFQREREITELAERLVNDYRRAIEQLNEATRKMDAARDYITIERNEVLHRLLKLELQINSLKIAIKRR